MEIASLHHVALAVSNLARSREFYGETLGLGELARPPFDFPGAWYALGDSQQLHLIDCTDPSFRDRKGLDTRDNHLAIRVPDYWATVEYLKARGFREDVAADDPAKLVLNPHATAGFPQIYVMDPDRHIIEINAERLG